MRMQDKRDMRASAARAPPPPPSAPYADAKRFSLADGLRYIADGRTETRIAAKTFTFSRS